MPENHLQTNNQAELMAAVIALHQTKIEDELILYKNSECVKNGTQDWYGLELFLKA